MGSEPHNRAEWLARFLLPIEPSLRRWLSHHRVPGLDVDDVVQETYAILAGLPSVGEIKNPKNYAFQTAYSVILAHVRRSRIVSITAVADLDIIANVSDEPSPERQAADREELRNVTLAIAALPKRVRDVFVLRRIECMSQREVADYLGISENSVEKCVAKGIQSLMFAFQRGGKVRAESQSSGEVACANNPISLFGGKKSV